MKTLFYTSCQRLGKLIFLLTCLGMPFAVQSDADKFLCIDGIQGSVNVQGFEGCSNVFTFSQSLVSRNTDEGGRIFSCGEATLVKQIDAASPALLLNVFRDSAIPEISIHFRTQDDSPVEFLTIELQNVMIESISNSEFSNGTGVSDLPINMESLELRAQISRFTFIPQNPDGTQGTPIGAVVVCFFRTAETF